MSAQGKERGETRGGSVNDQERADALEIARGVLNWHFPKTDDVWIIAAALDSALSEVAQLRAELQAAKQAIWGLQGGMKWVPEAEYRRLREAAQKAVSTIRDNLDYDFQVSEVGQALTNLAAALSEAPATEGSHAPDCALALNARHGCTCHVSAHPGEGT